MSTISKYFKVLNENVNSDVAQNSESPYKNVLNEIKALDLNSSNESSEFKTPKPLPKTKPKVLSKNTNTKKSSVKRRLNKKEQSPNKFNTKKTNYNLEHMHMAIALSKSLQDEDKEETIKGLDESNGNNASLMDIFQQYKFKSGNNYKLQSSNHHTLLERKRLKSRIQYVTPVLLLRTQEDRQQLISNKISLILSNNTSLKFNRKAKIQPTMFSKVLQKYYRRGHKIFNKSKYTTETTLNDFYTDALKIEHCAVKCGSLLKNWHKIPGRSKSPILRETLSTPSILNNRCITPDLFDSDDEELILKSPILKSNFSKVKSISPQSSDSLCLDTNTHSTGNVTTFKEQLETSSSDELFENDKGICVFETYSTENICVDLTQSSNEDSEMKETNLEVELQQSLKTGVSETFEKIVSLASNDDTIDYVYKLLDEEAKNPKSNSFREGVKLGDEHEELYSKEINLLCIGSALANQSDGHNFNQSSSSEASKADNCNNDSVEPQINFSNRQWGSFTSTNSEESISISDDEINYSCLYSTPQAQRKRRLSKKGSFYSLSEDSDSSEVGSLTTFITNPVNELQINSTINQFITNDVFENPEPVVNLENKHKEGTVLCDTLSKNVDIISDEKNRSASTPKTAVIVKSSDVTPMTNYTNMNTPKIVKELEKFGLKPLKRQQGIKLLKYIYETTHPLVNDIDSNCENNDRSKKRKTDSCGMNDDVTATSSNNEENSISPHLIGKNILGPNEEFVFERKQSKKVSSCIVPLHIAWHNLVSSNPNLQKNILLYKPLQLEDLYQMLKSQGYKYHIQDLLTFLDRKCITIRTDKTGRSRPKRKKSKTQLNFDQS